MECVRTVPTSIKLLVPCSHRCLYARLARMFLLSPPQTRRVSCAPLASPLRYGREYWMIQRGPGFLLGFSPTPFPSSPVSKLSLFLGLPMCRRPSLLTEEGGGRGAKSYDREKAWLTINHSILFASWLHTLLHCFSSLVFSFSVF